MSFPAVIIVVDRILLSDRTKNSQYDEENQLWLCQKSCEHPLSLACSAILS